MPPATLLRSAVLAIAMLNCAYAQGRGGRGIPNATTEQSAAVSQMIAGIAGPNQRLATARADLVTAALTQADVKVDAVGEAELARATALAEAFSRLQTSPAKLTPAQIPALAAMLGGAGGGRGGARTSMPHVTVKQADALTAMTAELASQVQAVNAARADLVSVALTQPSTIRARVDAVVKAELTLANARARALAKLQATSDKLDGEQIAWQAAAGGSFGGGGFTEPEPFDFNDHRGYIPLFDGQTLNGWDGNPKFWRVEGGAIVGESTPENPSGNTYIAYRGVVAKDFTLKFEIKIEGDGGSGLQYRSKTGIPWSRPIPANITANVGPVNLNWMMTGPQADFWPSRVYTGQFYSENTPMGIMAWRGEVVEGAGLGARRLMGTIGDREALGKLVKANDWNQYTVIARGGTFLHIVNGQLMAVMVDDDPESSNNQPGIFGIEIEATTKISVRNIWLKKLN